MKSFHSIYFYVPSHYWVLRDLYFFMPIRVMTTAVSILLIFRDELVRYNANQLTEEQGLKFEKVKDGINGFLQT